MERKSVFWFFCFKFILCYLCGISYAQLQTKEISYCAKNNAESTISSFWREINSHCAKDPNKLLDLYEQILRTDNAGTTSSKCDILLKHHVRKSLIDTVAVTLEEAFVFDTFRNDFELDRLLNRIHLSDDPLILDVIFKKFIDEVYLWVDKSDLALALFKYKNFQHMVGALLHFNRKLKSNDDYTAKLSTQMAFYMAYIQLNMQFSLLSSKLKVQLLKEIDAIPSDLIDLLSLRDVRMLNVGQWEYLYAPRELGPNNMKRLVFTWTAKKNSTDRDGNLILEFNDEGNIAIGSFYQGVIRYLYVDEIAQKPYFLLTRGADDTKWWHMLYYGKFVTFRNVKTKQLLCSTVPYNTARRYVTLGNEMSDYDVELACRWLLLDRLQAEMLAMQTSPPSAEQQIIR